MLALALTNMPPPPLDVCPRRDAGTSCLTRRRSNGVCVRTQCEKIEVGKDGSKIVLVDCLKCEELDGGTK